MCLSAPLPPFFSHWVSCLLCCGCVCYVVQHLHLLVMRILAHTWFHWCAIPQIVPSGVIMIWLLSLMFLWSFADSCSVTFDLFPVDAGSGFGLVFIYSFWPGYYMFHWCNVPNSTTTDERHSGGSCWFGSSEKAAKQIPSLEIPFTLTDTEYLDSTNGDKLVTTVKPLNCRASPALRSWYLSWRWHKNKGHSIFKK